MTTTEIAIAETAGGLAIRADQTRFDAMQLAALRQLGVDDAPQGDLDLFFHVAKRSGLDPFAKQIYMISRQQSVKDDSDSGWRKETKYGIQTAIDGYRVSGHRIALERGDELEVSDPLWSGKDGMWREIWAEAQPPAAAKYVITKNGHPFPAVVMYAEFVQTSGYGDKAKPNSMWAKMPANQLAKCAEAQAWRKVYPGDFSGVELEGTAPTVIDGDAVTTVRSERVAPGNTGLRARLGINQAQVESPQVDTSNEGEKPDIAQVGTPDEPEAQAGEGVTLAALLAMLGRLDVPKADRFALLGAILDRQVKSYAALTDVDRNTAALALDDFGADDEQRRGAITAVLEQIEGQPQ